MPAALRRHQYELLDRDERSLLVFGTEDTGYLTGPRPTFESGEMTTNNLPYGLGDGFSFGRDYLSTGGLHLFEGFIITDKINGLGTLDPESANEVACEDLRSAWREPSLRDHPSAHAILRKARADGTAWRTYGRPRKCDIVEAASTQQGVTPFSIDFEPYEEGWYSDVVSSVSRRLYTPPMVGIVSPIVSPITSAPATQRVGDFVVLGKRETWLSCTFLGPVTNPRAIVRRGSWQIQIGLDGHVPSGRSVQVDGAPWNRTVRQVHDGSPFAGQLSPSTPKLETLKIRPGQHTLTYQGIDPTGRTACTLEWRTKF